MELIPRRNFRNTQRVHNHGAARGACFRHHSLEVLLRSIFLVGRWSRCRLWNIIDHVIHKNGFIVANDLSEAGLPFASFDFDGDACICHFDPRDSGTCSNNRINYIVLEVPRTFVRCSRKPHPQLTGDPEHSGRGPTRREWRGGRSRLCGWRCCRRSRWARSGLRRRARSWTSSGR